MSKAVKTLINTLMIKNKQDLVPMLALMVNPKALVSMVAKRM
ncbi:hypothetical protein AO370_0002 [Moraxella catarrhalis]|uniref:Uncharacterized protein n=1 Tax=Moraxella catarrhalis TaxID=480 RepID=A0AB36DRL5_MORCA|nr:hypothetical protein AO370_0002 [Moraxella catarrhalis]